MSIKTIAIIGPESSGKTWLAKELAQYFEEPLVLEYSRIFLAKRNGLYAQEDLIDIAKGQHEEELNAISQAQSLVISDTCNLDIQVWSEVKYGTIRKGISDFNLRKEDTYYLLCSPDLPYESDTLRENPSIEKRQFIFETFLKLLKPESNLLGIVSGYGEIRLKNAIKLIQSKIKF